MSTDSEQGVVTRDRALELSVRTDNLSYEGSAWRELAAQGAHRLHVRDSSPDTQSVVIEQLLVLLAAVWVSWYQQGTFAIRSVPCHYVFTEVSNHVSRQ